MSQHDELMAMMAASGLVPPPAIPAPDDVESDLVESIDVDDLEELLSAEIAAAGPADATALVEQVEAAPEEVIEIEELDDEIPDFDAAPEELPEPIEDIDPELQAALSAELAAGDYVESPVVEQVEQVDDTLIEEVVATLERREDAYGAELPNVTFDATVVEYTPQAESFIKITLPPAAVSAAPVGRREARFAPGAAGDYVATMLGDENFKGMVDTLPKKVKEKAANLTDHIRSGRPLSVFTQAALSIIEAEGGFTNERLVRAFTSEATKRGVAQGYTIGTARSQAGQQVSLFSKLNIGLIREGRIVPNEESPIWQALRERRA